MTLPNLESKRYVILGLQGSGKTELAKHLARTGDRNYIIYDVHHEYKGLNRYMAEHKSVDRKKKNDPGTAELNYFVNSLVLGTKQIRHFILDEANRFCPCNYPLPASILILNDDNRHDRIAFGSVARRPAQLNTDLVELAHYLFIFRLTGRNDYRTLEDISEGLGDTVRGLEDYHFCVVDPARRYEIHTPIPMDV